MKIKSKIPTITAKVLIGQKGGIKNSINSRKKKKRQMLTLSAQI